MAKAKQPAPGAGVGEGEAVSETPLSPEAGTAMKKVWLSKATRVGALRFSPKHNPYTVSPAVFEALKADGAVERDEDAPTRG